MTRYCIRVPSEKSIPTTRLEVEFPGALEVTSIDPAAGWRGTAHKDRQGRILSAIWEGGQIPPKQYVEFGVQARNPSAQTDLTWKAIQTYQDGSEVHWIGSPRAQFPAAVTRVRGQGAEPRLAPTSCARGDPSSSHSY
jgi:uncharacterized protein YcnI